MPTFSIETSRSPQQRRPQKGERQIAGAIAAQDSVRRPPPRQCSTPSNRRLRDRRRQNAGEG